MRRKAATTLIALSGLAVPAAGWAQDEAPVGSVGEQRVVREVIVQPLHTLHRVIGDGVQSLTMTPRQERAAEERARAVIAERRIAALGVSLDTLNAIAACESGGDPTIVSSDGSYRGKYQFDYGTWASVGGTGDPAAAPEAEQDYRAALLYAQSGSSPWPVCGA